MASIKKPTEKKETNSSRPSRSKKQKATEETKNTVSVEDIKRKSVEKIVEDSINQDVIDKMVEDINAQQIMDDILSTFIVPTMVEPSVTLIHEPNPFKKIELAGRTCYKSEENITPSSAKKFVKMLKERQHFAMIEHASLAFLIDCDEGEEESLMNYMKFIQNQNFMRITLEPDIPRIIVSGNIRAIIERHVDDPVYKALVEKYPEFSDESEDLAEAYYTPIRAEIIDLRKIKDLTKDEFDSHFYFTAKFITDRGVSHEIVRHRLFSFAQESTRYCNYSKDKFGGHVTFCKPSTYDSWNNDAKDVFDTLLSSIDNVYQYLTTIENPLVPQQARAILPNCLKTEIVVTGPALEWRHFFNLRSKGTTGAPHPDMKVVADMALEKMNKYIRSQRFKNNLKF